MVHCSVAKNKVTRTGRVDMTSPTNVPGIGINVVVIIDRHNTSQLFSYNFPDSTYPLVFAKSTGQPFRFVVAATGNDSLNLEHNDKTTNCSSVNSVEREPILNAIIVERTKQRVTWEVPIESKRTIDWSVEKDQKKIINRATHLLFKYKVVYFVNIPFKYKQIFRDVASRWKTQLYAHADMCEPRQKHKILVNCDDDSCVDCVSPVVKRNHIQLCEESERVNISSITS